MCEARTAQLESPSLLDEGTPFCNRGTQRDNVVVGVRVPSPSRGASQSDIGTGCLDKRDVGILQQNAPVLPLTRGF
jgi:hypothetical protein